MSEQEFIEARIGEALPEGETREGTEVALGEWGTVEGHEVTVVEDRKPIVLPTGELVDLDDPDSCAHALARVKELTSYLAEVKGAVTDAFIEHSKRLGKSDIPLADGSSVKVARGYDLLWDHHQLEEDLRAAGMPEERINEIIIEEVSYKVKAIEANKAAKVNPEYAKAIEAARTEVEKRPTISLPRG